MFLTVELLYGTWEKRERKKKKTHHIKGLVEWLKKENITSLSS
jgi:hypothetical protein